MEWLPRCEIQAQKQDDRNKSPLVTWSSSSIQQRPVEKQDDCKCDFSFVMFFFFQVLLIFPHVLFVNLQAKKRGVKFKKKKDVNVCKYILTAQEKELNLVILHVNKWNLRGRYGWRRWRGKHLDTLTVMTEEESVRPAYRRL